MFADWFVPYLSKLSEQPVAQGVLAALATFVLEDPTTVGCGLLVADGRMAFLTALLGVWLGIAVGDVGLFGLGRLAGPRVIGRGPLRKERVDRASAWFNNNLVLAILVSRFVPGMRFPTYVGAGVLKASFLRFTVVAVAASLVWTSLLLAVTVELGERVLPLLGRYRWPVAVAGLLALFLFQRRLSQVVEQRSGGKEENQSEVSWFEFWPPVVFYAPIALYWTYLAVRFKGTLLPTVANPSIFTGGLIGESKDQILGLVPERHREWVAPWVTIIRGEDLGESLAAARTQMSSADLDYPVVAKPDLGQRGDGVRPIHDEVELKEYLVGFPVDEKLILQELVGFDVTESSCREGFAEAGVLYWRLPDEQNGRVFSITLKKFPFCEGDGQSTIRELIAADPRASRLSAVYCRRFEDELDRIPARGERFPLVFSGNHCQGAIFKNGTELKTQELEARFDEIARSMPEFYFGRFDVRFESLEQFLRGKAFKIVEVNGASAEATHIWDASISLTEAYRVLQKQFHALFEISARNRARGYRPMAIKTFLSQVIAYGKLAKRYPETR
jgi:membrane protein DedA with SNARE-associated domain